MKGKLSRREFLGWTSCSLAALARPWLAPAKAQDPESRPPNVILIMADDLGYGDISCYGGWVETPHIDALARGGMRFTDYHANGPVCSPTRAALLTGRYQQRCGIDEVVFANGPARETGMAQEETTFAEALKSCGYATGIFGKWHLGYNVPFNPTQQGFDEFIGYVSGNVDYHTHIDQAGIDDWWNHARRVPEDGYVTDLITQHAVDFIARHKDVPFCLYVPHEAPHYPYQGRNDEPERLPDGKVGRKLEGDDIRRAYREMVEIMDQSVGRIVETVRRLGLERNTLIVFCSDNGANRNGSNGPLRGFKGSLWEGGHRVPAIAYWPAHIKPAAICNQTVLSMDVFPTLVALAKGTVSAELKLDGANLLDLLTDGRTLPERTLFWAFRKQAAVRKGPWKLLVHNDTVQLFNLDNDVGERNDLAAQHPDLVASLQAELAAWKRDVSS